MGRELSENGEVDDAVEEPLGGRWSRRALLGVAAVGAGVATSTVLGAKPAGATSAGDVILGTNNTGGVGAQNQPNGASGTTGIYTNTGDALDALTSDTIDGGSGVYGTVNARSGVTATGVPGNAGVVGDASHTGIPGVLGLSNAGDGVIGVTSLNTGSGVLGVSTDLATGAFGVKGQSNGTGVFGSGGYFGVHGQSTADAVGGGVFGQDFSTAGLTGVIGTSTNGIGVRGNTNSTPSGLLGETTNGLAVPGVAGVVGDCGGATGVIGVSSSDSGVIGASSVGGTDAAGVVGLDLSAAGVAGVAISATSYAGTGLVATTESALNGGSGVYGVVVAKSGVTADGVPGSAGVVGDAAHEEIPGVLGLSNAGNGVIGVTSLNVGSGVLGVSTDQATGGFGVKGQSNGIGVYGQGGLYGVHGVNTTSAIGAAVIGNDNSSTGVAGVEGNSVNGTGVLGLTNSTQSGLLGETTNGLAVPGVAGVVGDCGSTTGVIGVSSSDSGVIGASSVGGSDAAGVVGLDLSPAGVAISATSYAGTGLVATTESALNGGSGVYGVVVAKSGVTAEGVLGTAGVVGDAAHEDIPGVLGLSNGGNGVVGVTSLNVGSGVLGVSTGLATGAFGVKGQSNGTGVFGSGGYFGVHGQSTADAIGGGVFGQDFSTAGLAGVAGTSINGSGVVGSTSAPKGTGIEGTATGATGIGASGTSNAAAGVGILASSTKGTALKVEGKLELSRSGLSTIAKGGKDVRVALAGVTSASLVIATIQGASGTVAVANVEPTTNAFTINLTGAAPAAIKVAWFVIN